MLNFSFHHVGIAVRDLQRAVAFFETLGFDRDQHWSADDNSMHIVLMRRGEVVIELFNHARGAQPGNALASLEDDIRVAGIRHFALKVPDIAAAVAALEDLGIKIVVPPRLGRTGNLIAFVHDPEGNWVEIVEPRRQ